MRSFLSASIVAIAVCAAVPAPASAQATGTSSSTQRPPAKPPQPRKPPAPKLPVEFRVFGVVEPQFMTASRTFDAVTGSPLLLGYGGGASLLNVWKRLFVRGGVTFASATGTNGNVVDGEFVSNGIETRFKFRTAEVGAGWRTPFKNNSRMAIYVGGGAVFLGYKETSDFATPDEQVNDSFTGFAGEVGLDWMLSKHSVFSFEGQYRATPSDPPHGSIQDQFGEPDLGGFAARVLFSIRFGKSAPAAAPRK